MHYQMYSTDFFQGLTLESRFTNITESCQQFPAPHKRLIDGLKQS